MSRVKKGPIIKYKGQTNDKAISLRTDNEDSDVVDSFCLSGLMMNNKRISFHLRTWKGGYENLGKDIQMP